MTVQSFLISQQNYPTGITSKPNLPKKEQSHEEFVASGGQMYDVKDNNGVITTFMIQPNQPIRAYRADGTEIVI